MNIRNRVDNLIVLTIILLSFSPPGLAQETDLKTPSEFLEKEIGADGILADWQDIESYYSRVAEVSPRVSLVNMGESTNGNKIIAALISSEENHKNLKELLDLQKELTWSEKRQSESWDQNKVFLLINCSMHSTEIGASQMSLELLHSFAKDNDQYTKDALDRLVIILIPSTNPDGINWITHWYDKWRGSEYEGTRYPFLYQEYAGHDNNRDWYMLNLKESQVVNYWMSKVWNPQVVWDAHQMGRSGWRAIIPPFVGPPNPFIHPLVLTGVENAGHAMKFQMVRDGMGGVAHSQTFSIWWNGGFRNTPYFKHSIGILSELSSAKIATRTTVTRESLENGRRGINHLIPTIKNPLPWQGGTWGLSDIIAYELSAAKGLIKFASRNSPEILENYRRMCLDSRKGDDIAPGGYIIPLNQHDIAAANRLVDVLRQHDIEVSQLSETLDFRGVEYPEGSIVISGQQPFRPMIRSLLERLDYPMDSEEGSNPYDVNASTLPDMMGVEIESLSKEYFSEFSENAKLREFRMLNSQGVSTSSGHTIFKAADSGSYKKINEIISLGGFINRDVEVKGEDKVDLFVQYDPSRDARARDISGEVEKAREESIKIPRLGLLRGNLNSISEGWTRYTLEQFSFPIRSLDEKRVREGKLVDDFDTIILPSIRENSLLGGNSGHYPEGYTPGIGKLGLQALEKFVLDGGTLVCIAESSRPVIRNFELPVADELRSIDREDFVIHGSLIKLDVDTAHPLAFGMAEEAAVMFYSSLAFDADAANEKVKVVARYAKRNSFIAGYAKGKEFIEGLAAMVEVEHGEGKVILIGFPCQFRGQTWATFKLLFNSLYSEGKAQEKLDIQFDNNEG